MGVLFVAIPRSYHLKSDKAVGFTLQSLTQTRKLTPTPITL